MNTRFYEEVNIPIDKVVLKGELCIPLNANVIIVFSHGSGSSRFSKRNQMVAKYLNERNIGTLLFDLLTEQEDQEYPNRFNIDLLTQRLTDATRWLERLPAAKNCRIGYFGASTGAASALRTAAILPQVSAVVSRGGRPDMAIDVLHHVEAPTLLIVGSLDTNVLELNKQAFKTLCGIKELVIVEGASHLFEEPGTMEKVEKLAFEWFEKYLNLVLH